jgi:hypothetical protein
VHTATRPLVNINEWLVEHDPLPVTLCRDADRTSVGFDARSTYVETYWLAVLGPSCVLAARRLVAWLEVEPEGFEISLAAFARTLGLGAGTGRHAPVVRTLTRLADFGLAYITDTYVVRASVPPLSARQIARLPDHLAAAHTSERSIETVQR